MQTTEWLEFQREVGHKVWRFDDGKIRANIIKLGLPFGKSILYIPHGPEIDFEHIKSGIKNELASFIKYLKDLAKQEGAIFVKMEPMSDVVMELIYRRGVKHSSKQIQPYRTVVIDLNLSEEHLLGRMHQKTRYNINLSEKKGLKLEESADIGIFWKLLKQTAKQDQFGTHPKEYYEKMIDFFSDDNLSTHSTRLPVRGPEQGPSGPVEWQGGEPVESTSSGSARELQAKLFLVNYEGKAIGGAVVMLYGDSVYYLHGAMDREYKSLMAPYFMHWEMIRKFKYLKFKYYDFWGIDHRKWPGVTRFKLGWGGDLKEYPGSFDLVIARLWYLGYRLARKIL